MENNNNLKMYKAQGLIKAAITRAVKLGKDPVKAGIDAGIKQGLPIEDATRMAKCFA